MVAQKRLALHNTKLWVKRGEIRVSSFFTLIHPEWFFLVLFYILIFHIECICTKSTAKHVYKLVYLSICLSVSDISVDWILLCNGLAWFFFFFALVTSLSSDLRTEYHKPHWKDTCIHHQMCMSDSVFKMSRSILVPNLPSPFTTDGLNFLKISCFNLFQFFNLSQNKSTDLKCALNEGSF